MAAPEAFRVFSVPVKATSLLGKEVRSGGETHRGQVQELVFDLPANRVRYALVSMAGEVSAYPMHALKLPYDRSAVRLESAADRVARVTDDKDLLPASELIGARFKDRQSGLAGTVVDVVLDAFWGKVAFAALALDGDSQLRPAPLDAFARKRHGEGLALLIDGGRLEALAGFTRGQLDAGVTDPDFLQREARNAHQLTPLR